MNSIDVMFDHKKYIGEIPTGSSVTGAPNRGGVGNNRLFSTYVSL